MSTNAHDDSQTVEMPKYSINLEPPIGTSFWSVQDVSLFSGERIYNSDQSHYITLDWACQCYIFTTNQVPDSDNFVNGGGAFYILFKHRGQVNSTLYPGYENFKLQIGSGLAIPTTHTPNHSTKDGDTWTATIDYEQAMQMFKNNGHEVFTHVAKYNNTFQLYKMNQYGGIVDGKIEAVFKSDENAGWNTPREIRGLSVFRQNQPNQWPINFKFEALGIFDSYTGTIAKSVTLELEF
ncbi:Lectin [Pleurotus pulmonarius]|nr:hypothetical protein EYR36_002006 [Pleurotus pulmonarius]KAF4588245.1 hypothetical protein EYR38_010212 [Pleurotus pulmonarius]